MDRGVYHLFARTQISASPLQTLPITREDTLLRESERQGYIGKDKREELLRLKVNVRRDYPTHDMDPSTLRPLQVMSIRTNGSIGA